LVLSYFLPWTITPLLMLGGAYLCYEGVEKVLEAVMPHQAHQHEAQLGTVALNPQSVEDEKVASAVKTDFILSAEIMAITLAALPAGSIWKQALVLAVVAIGITVAVYGVVALIVKADDVGLALATSDRASLVGRALGRGIVRSMPVLLKLLSVIGTAAMIWVGGGIILHGLEVYGPPAIEHAVKAAAEAAAHAAPPVAAIVEWVVEAAISGVIGLLIGAASIPVVGFVLAPAWKWLKHLLQRRQNRPAQ
jgi:predicted DNA repair protein MutK